MLNNTDTAARDKSLRLLVVADTPDDVELLEEAFLEVEEIRFTRDWLRPIDRAYAVDAREALAAAVQESFDAVLLDLGFGGGAGSMPVFHQLRERAPNLPVVLLAGPADEVLAMSLIRQGAQDCLFKTDLDCVPFARTLICAVGRQRVLTGHRSQSLIDEFTGMWNDRGFALVGQSQLGLAAHCGLPVLVASAEMRNPGNGESSFDVLEAAEQFRASLPTSAVTARLGGGRFAAMMVAAGAEDATEARRQLDARMDVKWTTVHPQAGFESSAAGALQSLCENVGVAARAGRYL